jgi:hypothetical protein
MGGSKVRRRVSCVLGTCTLLVGCGGSSSSRVLSAQEFKAKGNAICLTATRRLHELGTPTSESRFGPYLKKAIPLAESEVAQLSSLQAPAQYKQPMRDALSQSRSAASLLNGFAAKLASNQVKISAFADFSKQLDPLTKQINADYAKAGLPECAKEE